MHERTSSRAKQTYTRSQDYNALPEHNNPTQPRLHKNGLVQLLHASDRPKDYKGSLSSIVESPSVSSDQKLKCLVKKSKMTKLIGLESQMSECNPGAYSWHNSADEGHGVCARAALV